jgi:hypothetical protein
VTTIIVAEVDACNQTPDHEPHLRQPMWPRQDGKPHDPRWLWCLGAYDQNRQCRRVVIRLENDAETLVGEGLTTVGSALREKREPGECGECREPEDFDWDPLLIVSDGPVIVCHEHGRLAPSWAYEVEVGLEAWKNEPHHEPEPHLTVTAHITDRHGAVEDVYCGSQPEWAWPNVPWKRMMRRELLANRTSDPQGWRVTFTTTGENDG